MTTQSEIRKRMTIERRIVRKAVDQLLRDGFELGVDDSDDKPDFGIRKAPILALLFDLDDAYLVARKQGTRGWVRFVFGEDGWDVICDYTTNLEPHISEAIALSESLS